MGPRADPTPSSGFVLPEMRIDVNNYSVEGCLNMLLFPNLFWTARLLYFGKAGVITVYTVLFGGRFEEVRVSLCFSGSLRLGYL